MSHFKLKVGPWSLIWKELPKGREGSAWVQIQGGQEIQVHWQMDAQGIWMRTQEGLFGFDIVKMEDDLGQKSYSVSQRHANRRWRNISVDLGDAQSKAQSRGAQQKVIRLKSQMPGKIIRILVQPGQILVKDQPVIVMEAMKMENEIKAPQSGRVSQMNLKEGQAVESGAELLRIEPLERDLS